MRSLTYDEKTNISGGFAFWAFAVGFSMISSVVINLAQLIGNWVSGSNNSGHSYYSNSGSMAFLKISKYPSQSNIRVGVPWA